MPGFDRKGPQGAGPRTGRGTGLCGDLLDAWRKQRQEMGRGQGLGRGPGPGRGRGAGLGLRRCLRWFQEMRDNDNPK